MPSPRASTLTAKRAFDIVVSLVLLLFLAPLFLAIAIAIKLDSPGPVFFSHERVRARRRDGRWVVETFSFHKFRSMIHGADPSVHEAHVAAYVNGDLQPRTDGARFKLANDDRVTPFGAVLRRTSLDELPQLWNVLCGQMSLVGPRPLPVYEAVRHDAQQLERLAATPGITGPWQVSGRCELSFDEMMALDLAYVRERNFWTDMKLLCRTVPAVVSGKGAE